MVGGIGRNPGPAGGPSSWWRLVWLIPVVAAGMAFVAVRGALEHAGSAATGGRPASIRVPHRGRKPLARDSGSVATPRPFDPSRGAPLPSHRIIAVYGIIYGAEGNGFASTLPMLNGYLPQLTQLGRQYAALDPTHGVEPAVDLVVNPLKPCSEAPNWCSFWPPAATMQAYVRFCRQHHLLLFFDLQLGTEPVQDAIMHHLLPYLERYRFAEVALDTEFHFPNTAAGYADAQNYPCCLGWMDASEINWVEAELASISRREHLPRKVLVIHQWDPSVIHNKDQIRLNPDVSLVVQSDGWGATYYKLNNYTRFVQQSPVEYGGYKIFLPHVGDTEFDVPVQTPQQVLQLFPQPLFVSYQ